MFRFPVSYRPRVHFPDGKTAHVCAEAFEPEPIDRKLQATRIRQIPEPLWMQKSTPAAFSAFPDEPDCESRKALCEVLDILDSFGC